MKWIFPRIKTKRTVEQQFSKIKDEWIEYQKACSQTNKDEEAIDILHSVETFLRLQFKDRETELDKLIQKTIAKNISRGYYESECF